MTTSQEENIILQETLEPGLKHSLISNFKKWTEAFLELADNAVSNRILEKKLIVEINNSNKYLRITNRGGSGMDLVKLQEFLEWGKIKNRSPYDIGAYSQGGKSAMGYLGREMEVTASPSGEYISYTLEDFDLHDFGKLKKYNVRKLKTNYYEGLVEVKVSQLKRPIKDDELESLVVDTYRPLIENGEVEFPGFRVAKGHILYLLETAAIQLAKPTEKDEKMTSDEFIESFDEFYSFFYTNLDLAKEKLDKKKITSK